MTRHDDALEQMRNANPLMGIGDVDADELGLSRSHFEERRLAMTTRTPTQRDRVRTRRAPIWRRVLIVASAPVFVAASAFVLVFALLGVGTVMIRGSASEAPATGEPETVITISIGTSTPEASLMVAPEEPTIESGVRVLSTVPEHGTNLVLAADGLPMLLSTARSGDDYPGAARLFRCADVACDEFEVESLENLPMMDPVVIAPNGDIYGSVFRSNDPVVIETGLHSDGAFEFLPVLFDTNRVTLPVAFDDAGNPIFVRHDGADPAAAHLVACSDPLCGEYVRIELGSGTLHGGLPTVIPSADALTVVYAIGEPTGPPSPEAGYDGAEAVYQTMVATITDLGSSSLLSTQLVHEDLNTIPIEAALSESGELLIWLWEYDGGISVIECTDPTCSDTVVTSNDVVGSQIVGEIDSQMRPVAVYTEVVYDPDEYAAYLEAQVTFDVAVAAAADEEGRSYPEDVEGESPTMPESLGANYVVARCIDSACTSVERTTIATTDAILQYPYRDSLRLEIAPDGMILVAMASVEESPNPGLSLFVFPDGELGVGVEPIAGHGVAQWPAS